MLITCPECGKQISDRASACPQCGFPLEELRRKNVMVIFDPETMTGKTDADILAIEVAQDFYGELLGIRIGDLGAECLYLSLYHALSPSET